MAAIPSNGNAFSGLGQLPKNVAGIVDRLHWSLVFTRWAASLHNPPTVAQISERFGVSRATSYRYKAAWEAAVGAGYAPPPKDLRAYYPKHRNLSA
jgi:hypothetical protein